MIPPGVNAYQRDKCKLTCKPIASIVPPMMAWIVGDRPYLSHEGSDVAQLSWVDRVLAPLPAGYRYEIAHEI
jgi:hypothetical protein